MNRIRLSLITLGVIGTSLSAAWFNGDVEVLAEYPLPLNERSVDNGGTKTLTEASGDGIGVIIDNAEIGNSNKVDNSAFNTLLYKYGKEAEISGLSLADYVINEYNNGNPKITRVDYNFANEIKNNISNSNLTIKDEVICDDNNPETINDNYKNGICVGITGKFLSPRGDDNNNCTFDNPCETLDANNINSNDTVILLNGDYNGMFILSTYASAPNVFKCERELSNLNIYGESQNGVKIYITDTSARDEHAFMYHTFSNLYNMTFIKNFSTGTNYKDSISHYDSGTKYNNIIFNYTGQTYSLNYHNSSTIEDQVYYNNCSFDGILLNNYSGYQTVTNDILYPIF